jgi:hypothetical protein
MCSVGLSHRRERRRQEAEARAATARLLSPPIALGMGNMADRMRKRWHRLGEGRLGWLFKNESSPTTRAIIGGVGALIFVPVIKEQGWVIGLGSAFVCGIVLSFVLHVANRRAESEDDVENG